MATDDDYLRLRRMTGEVGSDTYSNTDLERFLTDSEDDFQLAASRIWGEKAGAYADLVDIAEAGSSRKNSDLFKHAREQQAYFETISGTGAATAPAASTTRRIVRQ